MSTASTSQSIEWYHPGNARTVVVDGVEVTVRLVARDGRRARIAIAAPPGATFRSEDADKVRSGGDGKK